MIKLVAFDWNGTLLPDSKPAWECDNIIFKRYGRKPISYKRFQETFDIPISKYWTANGLDEKVFSEHHEEIHDEFFRIYSAKVAKSRTRAGAKEVLKWLDRNKIAAIIYSNHFVHDIKSHLSRLGMLEYFCDILGRPKKSQEHMHNRFKETNLRNYIKNKGYGLDEVMSVGDTVEELEIGHSLGICAVALTGGHNSTKRLKTCKPDFLIHNLKDLIVIIKKLNSPRP